MEALIGFSIGLLIVGGIFADRKYRQNKHDRKVFEKIFDGQSYEQVVSKINQFTDKMQCVELSLGSRERAGIIDPRFWSHKEGGKYYLKIKDVIYAKQKQLEESEEPKYNEYLDKFNGM